MNDLDVQTGQARGRRRYADLAWTCGSLEPGQHSPPSQAHAAITINALSIIAHGHWLTFILQHSMIDRWHARWLLDRDATLPSSLKHFVVVREQALSVLVFEEE